MRRCAYSNREAYYFSSRSEEWNPLLYNTGWESLRVEGIVPGRLATLGEWVLRYLRDRGLTIPGGNRLQLAVRTTRRYNDAANLAAADDVALGKAAEAFRTLWESVLIIDARLSARRGERVLPTESLACLLRGAEHPAEDKDTSARNEQFELFVGAFLLHGVLNVIRAEPDFQFVYLREWTGVAVKRVRSTRPQTLRDELRDAARQIIRAGTRGFIALSLDTWLTELHTDGTTEELGASFDDLLERAYALIQDQSERRALLGAIVLGVVLRWERGELHPILRFSTPWKIINFSDDGDVGSSIDFFARFKERFHANLGRVAGLATVRPVG